jgi:heme exporter protein D
MGIQIDWAIVSISLAVVTIVVYFYLWVLALIRRKKARDDVRKNQARLNRLINVLKQKSKKI